MRKKKTGTEETGFAPQGTRPRLSPIDIQQKEFRLAFRGYNERDVDEFLDRLTEDLAAYVEENGRLRDGDGVAGSAAPASATVGASLEAEEILARAREQADAIVREAETRAATIVSSAGTGDARTVIAPYLTRERAFLQSLGELVKEHAEAVRAMVKATKDAPAPARPDRAEVIRIDPIRQEEAGDSVAPSGSGVDTAQAEATAEGRSVRELFWGED